MKVYGGIWKYVYVAIWGMWGYGRLAARGGEAGVRMSRGSGIPNNDCLRQAIDLSMSQSE